LTLHFLSMYGTYTAVLQIRIKFKLIQSLDLVAQNAAFGSKYYSHEP
jgi:deferrochelatase/peroxidase EfeB